MSSENVDFNKALDAVIAGAQKLMEGCKTRPEGYYSDTSRIAAAELSWKIYEATVVADRGPKLLVGKTVPAFDPDYQQERRALALDLKEAPKTCGSTSPKPFDMALTAEYDACKVKGTPDSVRAADPTTDLSFRLADGCWAGMPAIADDQLPREARAATASDILNAYSAYHHKFGTHPKAVVIDAVERAVNLEKYKNIDTPIIIQYVPAVCVEPGFLFMDAPANLNFPPMKIVGSKSGMTCVVDDTHTADAVFKSMRDTPGRVIYLHVSPERFKDEIGIRGWLDTIGSGSNTQVRVRSDHTLYGPWVRASRTVDSPVDFNFGDVQAAKNRRQGIANGYGILDVSSMGYCRIRQLLGLSAGSKCLTFHGLPVRLSMSQANDFVLI